MPIGWFEYQSILLVIVRVTALIAVAPILGDRQIPGMIKAGLGLFLAFLLVPVIQPAPSHFTTVPGFIIAVGKEIMVGVTLGFVADMMFYGIQFSGQFVSLQMGFAAAQLFDPSTENNVPVIGQFYYIVAVLLYLAVGGHQFLIEALQASFQSIPLTGLQFEESFFRYIIKLSSDVFVIALKIAAPIFVTILLTEVALGMIARLVPQMNIFIFGFPLKILVGMIMIAISMPIFGRIFRVVYQSSQFDVHRIIQLISP